jgi:hypothetical protein
VAEALRLPPEIASIAFVSILETAADKFVGLTRRAGAELAGLDEPDPTLVRHLHDLHALREHYDAAEVIALAREVMLADAKAYGNQFPAYRGTRCAKRCAPSKASRPILATLGGLLPGAENATKRHQAHTPEPPPKEVRHPRRSCDLSSLTSSAAHSRASGTLDCGRRLAAQRDAVTADDVAAHGGFSWLVRRPAAASGPTHALFAAQSHSIVDNLVVLLRYRRALDCSPANCMRLALIS